MRRGRRNLRDISSPGIGSSGADLPAGAGRATTAGPQKRIFWGSANLSGLYGERCQMRPWEGRLPAAALGAGEPPKGGGPGGEAAGSASRSPPSGAAAAARLTLLAGSLCGRRILFEWRKASPCGGELECNKSFFRQHAPTAAIHDSGANTQALEGHRQQAAAAFNNASGIGG